MRSSIIVTALNEEKILSICLKSLRAQETRAPFELIVSDGLSEDATREIASSLADKVVVAPKRTIAAGRQKGALEAKGDVLVFADADTFYPPKWLERLLSPFEQGDVVCAQGKLLVQDATFIEHAFAKHVAPLYFKAALLIGVPTGAGSNLAVRSDAFHKAGGFNTNLVTAEDLDLQKRLLGLGKNVFVDEAVAYVSPRRIRSWGYRRYLVFHLKNWATYALGHKPARAYEPIR